MANANVLIDLIRESRYDEALELLNASPGLATERLGEEGQMDGASPLHWAAHRNAVKLCERLIELGASVNDSATQWWLTPLAWAADAGSAEAVELLLVHGADVNQDAVVGTTPLHSAAMGGSSAGSRDPAAYRRTAEILIAHGADVNRAFGADKRTPLGEAGRPVTTSRTFARGSPSLRDRPMRVRGTPDMTRTRRPTNERFPIAAVVAPIGRGMPSEPRARRILTAFGSFGDGLPSPCCHTDSTALG